MKKETSLIETICCLALFASAVLFGMQNFNPVNIVSSIGFCCIPISVLTLYMYSLKYPPHKINEKIDNGILTASYFLNQGEGEIFLKFKLPIMIYCIIVTLVDGFTPSKIMTLSEFSATTGLNYIFIYFLTKTIWTFLKKSVNKDLIKKTYLLERSVFKYKPVFN